MSEILLYTAILIIVSGTLTYMFSEGTTDERAYKGIVAASVIGSIAVLFWIIILASIVVGLGL